MALRIIETFDVAAPPRDLELVLVDVAVDMGWSPTRDDASEITTPWRFKVDQELRRHLSIADAGGRHVAYAFNSVSDYMIQGSTYIELSDAPEVKAAKLLRSHLGTFSTYLSSISPRQFEAVCRGVLQILGCERPTLTSHGSDQGIDFFGKLQLKGRLANSSVLPGFDNRLSIWMVGQSKHFQKSHVSTPDLRELVGSVELARTKTFADSGSALVGLDLAALDPVFYLFITTGQISRDGWRLLERSGMVAMDGPMVVNFLAENQIGISNGGFDLASADAWIDGHLTSHP